jgi:Type I phosphodiesterase / nucleotide pyrophosphatase
MINDHTLARFAPLGGGLVAPLHDYSFGRLSATLHKLLTGEEIAPTLPVDCFGGSWPAPRKVVLFFIDSFGWQFWQRWAERSRIMRGVVDNGILTPISALFPSTTSASVTTLNLGCLPAEHAVYEWNMYVPAYGETIKSLPFTTLGNRPTPGEKMGWDVADLLAVHTTMHQRLAAQGVRSIQLAHGSYAGSQYNRIASAGSEVRPHFTLAEALVQLREALDSVPEKALIQFYWAGLDTAAHIHGPGTVVHEAEVAAFWATLDTLLEGLHSPDTLFLFTADHGHIRVPAEETVFVNERWPRIAPWLARSRTGSTIWPNGSPRDMFLHIAPEHRAAALDLLTEKLTGIAEVMTVDAAIAHNLFGVAPVGAELRRRLGDILVLPRLGHFVWWREPGLLGNHLHGHHGGLTREELVTVLGVAHEI